MLSNLTVLGQAISTLTPDDRPRWTIDATRQLHVEGCDTYDQFSVDWAAMGRGDLTGSTPTTGSCTDCMSQGTFAAAARLEWYAFRVANAGTRLEEVQDKLLPKLTDPDLHEEHMRPELESHLSDYIGANHHLNPLVRPPAGGHLNYLDDVQDHWGLQAAHGAVASDVRTDAAMEAMRHAARDLQTTWTALIETRPTLLGYQRLHGVVRPSRRELVAGPADTGLVSLSYDYDELLATALLLESPPMMRGRHGYAIFELPLAGELDADLWEQFSHPDAESKVLELALDAYATSRDDDDAPTFCDLVDGVRAALA